MNWKYILKEEEDEKPKYETSEEKRIRREEKGEYEKKLPSGKKFTFVEGKGAINDADIANWFKTIEQHFEDMLSGLGVTEVQTIDREGTLGVDKKDTLWKKKVKEKGMFIASELLKGATEGYLREVEKKYTSSAGMEADPKYHPNEYDRPAEIGEDEWEETSDMPNVDSIFTSPEYTGMLTKTLDSVETMMSVIFDAAYRKIKWDIDDPPDNWEDLEDVDIRPDDELSNDLITEIATSSMLGAEADKEMFNVLDDFEKALEGGFGQPEKSPYVTDDDESTEEDEHGKLKLTPNEALSIKHHVRKAFQEADVQAAIRELKAYIYMSFALKYPLALRAMGQHPEGDKPELVAQQEGVTPAEGYSSSPLVDYESGKFEDELLDEEGTDAERRTRAEQDPRNVAVDETEEQRAARIEEDKLEEDELEYLEQDDTTPTEDADRRKRRFESKYASTNQSPKSWMDVLKNTGPTLASSQGFAPAMHNLRYSCGCDNPDCNCEE